MFPEGRRRVSWSSVEIESDHCFNCSGNGGISLKPLKGFVAFQGALGPEDEPTLKF